MTNEELAAELERLIAKARKPAAFEIADNIADFVLSNEAAIVSALRDAQRLREALRFLETEDVGKGEGSFGAWMHELNEQVIQEEYGYEPGEFAAYPSLWVFSFAKGYSPSEAFKRACEAHRDEREKERARSALTASEPTP